MRNIGKICILFLLFVLYQQATAQNAADSLLNILKPSKEDTSKINLLNDIFKIYLETDPIKAFHYANQAKDLSIKIPFQRGLASSYNNIGLANFKKGDFTAALDNYLMAIEIFNEIDYKRGASITLANIGYLFYSQGNYPKTIEYYVQSLSIAQQIGDKQRSASLLGNIGIVYYEQGYYAKALEYYIQSLSIREEIDDKQGIAYVLGNIGLIYDDQKNYAKTLEYYQKSLMIQQEINDEKGIANTLSNIGTIYHTQKEYVKALEYFQRANTIATRIDYKKVIASSLNNIGDVYKAQQQYPKALEYYNKTLKINQEIPNKQGISYSYNSIGDVYKITGNNENALTYFFLSLDVAKETGLNEYIKDNYQKISETYAASGKFELAFQYHKLYAEIKDSIYNEKSMNQIADMQAKYETSEKEKENKLLKKDREVSDLKISQNKFLMYALIIAFIFIGLISFLIFNNYRHKQRVKQMNAEIALQKSEEKYRDLANLLPQMMFEVDHANWFTFINIAGLAMTGYIGEEILEGIEITDIFANDEKDKLFNDLKVLYSGVELKSREYFAKRKDGTVFPALCYFSSYTDKEKIKGLRGIAIDITELKQVERRILNKIVEAEEKERKRVAKDLHDGLGPLLSSIKLYINELESPDTEQNEKNEMLKYTNELIDDAVSSTRTIANNLMPGIITDYGLVKALQAFCKKLNIAKSVNISFDADDETRRYDVIIEITLYRVIMEIINNALKHASSKNIEISFRQQNNSLYIECKDDGVGFNVEQALNNPDKGMGLNNIVNRLKSIQGTCDFHSEKGKGVIIKMEINLYNFKIISI